MTRNKKRAMPKRQRDPRTTTDTAAALACCAPSMTAVAHALMLEAELVRRQLEHARRCDCPKTCAFRLTKRATSHAEFVHGALLRRALREEDDVEVELHRLFHDLQEIIDESVTFKQFSKVYMNAMTLLDQEGCLPCMTVAADDDAPWKSMKPTEGTDGPVLRLIAQHGTKLSPAAVEQSRGLVRWLWDRGGIPPAKPVTLAAAIFHLAAGEVGETIAPDRVADAFRVGEGSVVACAAKLIKV